MMKEEFFKISSELKNLIGSELITDNYVAIFELVKNSFDAKATVVKIIFENIYSEKAKIIIQDNGKGMDYEDLINKWLFVAYSAKRDGSEDELDYRNKTYAERYYAGAKGIGRFSCDRLGRFLNLITIKDTKEAKIENLFVDWSKFEEDQNEEFIRIPVEHKVLDDCKYNITHGTILEITGIKTDEWNRDNLKKLKNKLSKLIRPDLNKTLRESSFRIILEVPDENNNDNLEIEKGKAKGESEGYFYYNTINGKIKNFVFDELDIRTTKIISIVSKDGENIITRLVDRDFFIYEIKEHNKYNLLRNTSLTLYFLNRSAKNVFSRRMGIRPVDYGNLFIYKNGFRIYPYGERGDDSLGLDNRAVQGYSRFIGLRNLIGQIDIQGKNDELREATSRDAGLIKTKAYYQLADTSPYSDSLLLDTLKRLEKYVVEVTQWGVNLDVDMQDLNNDNIKRNLVKLISNITDDKFLKALDYNKDIIKLIGEQEGSSAKKLIRNFKRIAAESNNSNLLKDAQRLEKTMLSALEAKESAEKEARDIKEELEQEVRQSLFQKSIIGREKQDLLSLQHQIEHTASSISWSLDKLIAAIERGESKDKLIEHINNISLEVQKVTSASNFVTKANFNLNAIKIKEDLVKYINDYVENIFKPFDHYIHEKNPIHISIDNQSKCSLNTRFVPLEVSVIIDNLFTNSKKAGAKYVYLKWQDKNDGFLTLLFKDDGIGIPDKNLNKVFDFSFSTTEGSGIGLSHIKQIMEKMCGAVTINNTLSKGVEFIIKFKK